jgi:hypothetical protein
MAGKALHDYEEVERRRYHERIRADLVQRGAIVDTRRVEQLLRDATPRFEDKGWKVTERREQGSG